MSLDQIVSRALQSGLDVARRGADAGAKAVEKPVVQEGDRLAISAAFRGDLAKRGVTAPADMGVKDLAGLRRYLKDVDNSYDLQDAVRGLQAGLDAGERDARKLSVAAEQGLYAQRRVSPADFAKLQAAGFTGEQLERLRRFADGSATSQGGKYLTKAAREVRGADLAAARKLVTRDVATDAGLHAPVTVDDRVLLSLLRDMGTEDPRDAAAIAATANDAFKRGATDYYAVHAQATRRLLGDLGVDRATLAGLDVSDQALKAAKPGMEVRVARAEQLRLLRDRLRVLPASERPQAVATLKGARLTTFDAALQPHFDARVAALAGNNPALAGELTRTMSVQQRANLVSDLANLPAATRAATFAGLTGSPAEMAATATNRLVATVEDRFDVKVHRAAGQSPFAGRGADASVLDWSLQGATELHNGLEALTRGRKLDAVRGTTYFHIAGSDAAPNALALAHERDMGTLYRPGAGAYRPNQSGLVGREFRGMGYRTQVDGNEYVAFYDTALKLDNSNRVAGVSRGEGTIVHETGHVVQLGGANEAQDVAAWSKLSNWRESDGSVADAYYGPPGNRVNYYKDPGVQVGRRQQVVSQYGATDPVEDWAEYTRTFMLDPQLAMKVAPEKFRFMNAVYDERYTPDRVALIARSAR